MEKKDLEHIEHNELDFVERTLIIFIVVFLGLCVAVVAEAAYPRPPTETAVGWSAPSIPHCDKELWIRIKDRCRNE